MTGNGLSGPADQSGYLLPKQDTSDSKMCFDDAIPTNYNPIPNRDDLSMILTQSAS
jgi:hypothetical protein